MTTTCPGFTVRTSAPTSSTMPIASWPICRPDGVGSMSLYGQRSLPQTHARVMRMSASVGFLIAASGTFSIRTSPALYMTVAFMVSVVLSWARTSSLKRGCVVSRLLGELVPMADDVRRVDLGLPVAWRNLFKGDRNGLLAISKNARHSFDDCVRQ